MADQILIATRREPRLFAKIETAFELLRSLQVPRVEVLTAGYESKPRAYRRGRPGALKALLKSRDSRQASCRPLRAFAYGLGHDARSHPP